MNATTIEQSVQQLKSTTLAAIQHKTMQVYTGEPHFQNEQLYFLLLPQLVGEAWSEQVVTGAVTTAIVHTSLCEHNRIVAKDAVTKEQQLIVLAGDYYSGRYYQLLAKSGNILLIQKLSGAIIERCEHEVKVYEETTQSFAVWVNSLTVIQTALIASFYEVFGFGRHTAMMQQALTIYSLQQMRKQQASPFSAQITAFGEELIAAEVKKRQQALQTLLQQANYPEQIKQQILTIVA